MHGGVRGIRDPWLLVNHRKPPIAAACACEMVEPRYRTIVDVEGQTFFDQTAERKSDGRLDRSAMCNGDHVLTGVIGIDAINRALHAVEEIHEALAARRGLVDRCKPVATDRSARQKRRAIHPLPFAKMLFGESLLLRHDSRLRKTCRPDRIRGLMRALQIARIPDCITRQDFADRIEHHTVAGVATQILLPVDAAAILANRRMAHPPPSSSDNTFRCSN